MTYAPRKGTSLSQEELQLLREVVEHAAPERTDLLAAAEANTLMRAQREELCGLISSEFSRIGLGDNYEPNAKGIELERLLDTINRPNLYDG